MNVKKLKKAQGGFSLLELLLVVAVGAVLILAGLGAYRLVTGNNNINTAQRQLNVLKQQVQNNYSGQNNYGTAGANITPALVNMRAFPQDLADAGADGTDNFRRGVFGDVSVSVGANVRTFSITFADVPRAACVRLGTLFNTTNTADFNFVNVNNSGNLDTPALTTPAELSTRCNNANDQNIMVFNFD